MFLAELDNAGQERIPVDRALALEMLVENPFNRRILKVFSSELAEADARLNNYPCRYL
jgi:hypothetical protein